MRFPLGFMGPCHFALTAWGPSLSTSRTRSPTGADSSVRTSTWGTHTHTHTHNYIHPSNFIKLQLNNNIDYLTVRSSLLTQLLAL